MIKGVKRWLNGQRDMMRKTAGLAEKEVSIKQKLDAAMNILQDEREEDVPVLRERRLNGHAA